jgi:hypothetical protein
MLAELDNPNNVISRHSPQLASRDFELHAIDAQ